MLLKDMISLMFHSLRSGSYSNYEIHIGKYLESSQLQLQVSYNIGHLCGANHSLLKISYFQKRPSDTYREGPSCIINL